MDILALPDLFLDDLMKTVTMQDRLRMRKVCRLVVSILCFDSISSSGLEINFNRTLSGFEKLVANSHGGFVSFGHIELEGNGVRFPC